MRIAIFADIHGNLPAFEAALEHAAGLHVDRMVIAGDVVNGAPDSGACWRLARSLGCPILRGNHERYVYHYDTPHAPAIWASEQFAPVRWARAQISAEERQVMENLPFSLRLPEAPDILFVHSSLRSDNDAIAVYTPEAELPEMFPEARERYIVRGHNHAGMIKPWRERLILTTGSIGLPLDGIATAQYLLLEQHPTGWHVRHQSVPYDIDAAVRRFTESGYIEAGGPMARLFLREVITASFHIVPFFRAYSRWQAEAPISLSAAVDRFLSLC